MRATPVRRLNMTDAQLPAGMAYIVMTCIVMAYIVMADIVIMATDAQFSTSMPVHMLMHMIGHSSRCKQATARDINRSKLEI